jgi:cell division protein FtsB
MRSVGAIKLMAAVFGVFLLAALAVYFFGDSGIVAYRDLDKYEKDLAANVSNLQQRNSTLKKELAQLQTDSESNAVLARGIGLYASGEAVVKLEGLPSRSESYSVGSLLNMKKPAENHNAFLKASALVVLCLIMASFFITSLQARRKPRAGQRR